MLEYNTNTSLDNKEAVILFSTSSCIPCKNMKEILNKFEKIHSNKIDFFNVDISNHPVLAKKFNIKSVPTTVFYKNSEIKDRFSGFIDDVDLESKMMNLLFSFEEDFDENLDLF